MGIDGFDWSIEMDLSTGSPINEDTVRCRDTMGKRGKLVPCQCLHCKGTSFQTQSTRQRHISTFGFWVKSRKKSKILQDESAHCSMYTPNGDGISESTASAATQNELASDTSSSSVESLCDKDCIESEHLSLDTHTSDNSQDDQACYANIDGTFLKAYFQVIFCCKHFIFLSYFIFQDLFSLSSVIGYLWIPAVRPRRYYDHPTITASFSVVALLSVL